MSENLHDIDDLFRSNLDDYEAVPSAQVWEQLEQKLDAGNALPANNRRRFGHYPIWTAGIILIATLTTLLLWSTTQEGDSATTESTGSYEQKAAGDTAATNAQSRQTENNNHAPLSETETTALSTEVSADQQASMQSKAAEQRSKKSAGAATIVSSDLTNPTGTLQKSGNNQIKRSNIALPSNATSGSNAIPLSATQNFQSGFDDAGTGMKAQATSGATNDNRLGFNRFLYRSNETAMPAPKPAPSFAAMQLGASHTNSATAAAAASLPNLKSTARPSFSLAGFYRVEGSNNKVSNDRPAGRHDDRRAIKERESQTSSFTTGLQAAAQLGKNWGLYTGLQLQQQKSSIKGYDMVAQRGPDGRVRYRLDCQAGYVYLDKNDTPQPPAPGDSARSLPGESTLQYIGIPVGVSYRIKAGNKFSITPQADVQWQIKTRGTVQSGIQTVSSKTLITQPVSGLKSSYAGAYIGVEGSYRLGKKAEIMLAPGYRFSLTPVNKNTSVKTSLHAAGIAAGIRVKW